MFYMFNEDVGYSLEEAEQDAFIDRMVEHYYSNQEGDRDWYELTNKEKHEFEILFREYEEEKTKKNEIIYNPFKYYMVSR